MTISTTANRADYTGDNCVKVFAYTFKILADTDLDVFVAGTQQTLTTNYTVSGAGAETGGSVTFVTAPGCNLAVAVVRDVPYTQQTDYNEGSAFPAASHEDALDKLTMLAQQVKELATRSWRFAAGSVRAATGYTVDEPQASKYARIKSDCSGVEYVALTACGTYADPVTTKGDLIVGGDTGGQERLGIASGSTLVASPLTGKPSWQPGLMVSLTNNTDGQADAGRIFAVSMECNSTFVAADVDGCGRVMVVSPESVGDDCLAVMLFAGGPVTMLAQGAIARGEYVKKGSTVGAVQTTCVPMTHFRPVPKGAVGIALSHAAGNCVTMLKFPAPANGLQGVPSVRRNLSASNATTQCTKVDLIADYLTLVDSCNDIVVVKNPATLTNDITVDLLNKKNSRDQAGAFSAGDIHFYWTYEGVSGTPYSRSSAKGPNTSGPEMPACETHWAYSHSAYWDGNCIRRHVVRGAGVYFECLDSTRVLNAASANCETRVGLATIVPAIATRVRLLVRYTDTASSVVGDRLLIGYRLQCIAYILGGVVSDSDATVTELELPNVNQEFYYRNTGTPEITVHVTGYDVPNGDS